MKKKEQEENTEKKPSKFQTFRKNYREIPAFNALVKLGFYIIFFSIIIVVVAFGEPAHKETPSTTKPKPPEEEEVVTKTYKELLDDVLLDNNDLKYEISTENKRYIIDYRILENTFSGIIETEEGLTKFEYKDNRYYEIKLDKEVETEELFAGINLEYLNIYSLVSILSTSKSLKTLTDDNTVYNYNLENANITVTADKKNISKINISEGTNTYSITLEVNGG